MRDFIAEPMRHMHEASSRGKLVAFSVTAGLILLATIVTIISAHATDTGESHAKAAEANQPTGQQQDRGAHVSTTITHAASSSRTGGVSHSGVNVEVNGKKVDASGDKSYHKTIRNGNGVTHIDVRTDGGDSNSNTLSVSSSVTQSSDSVEYTYESNEP